MSLYMEGREATGRPRKMWEEGVRRDLQDKGLTRDVRNRRAWTAAIS